MLSNAYFLAKFRFDTAENEPAKNLQILQKEIKNVHFSNFAGFEGFARTPDLRRVRGGPGGHRQPLLGRRHDGRSAKFRQNVARFRLYRHRFVQEDTVLHHSSKS